MGRSIFNFRSYEGNGFPARGEMIQESRSTSTAATASDRCDGFVTPTMGEVTDGHGRSAGRRAAAMADVQAAVAWLASRLAGA